MNLRTKWASVCRQILTPLRKYFLVKRFWKKLPDNFKNRLKNSGIKLQLCFLYKPNKIGKRPFGIVAGMMQQNTLRGVVLRCGCHYLGFGNRSAAEAYELHKDVTSHRRLLR